jgi:hypothetical protein
VLAGDSRTIPFTVFEATNPVASIYKKGRDKGKKGVPYYFDFSDHTGKRITERGFTDKGETERLAAMREQDAMRRRKGLIDPAEEKLAGHRLAPIDDHLAAFERKLAAGTSKAEHVQRTINRLRRIIDGCGVTSLPDLDTETVETFLTGFREREGIGHRTHNHYIQAVDGFGRWLVATKRTAVNPVAGLRRLNAEVDVRHKRRALSPDEFAKLLASARSK